MTDQRKILAQWISDNLKAMGHGSKGKLADFLGVRPDAVTRMLNTEPGKELRDISATELVQIGQFFKKTPPGLSSPNTGEALPESELRPITDRMTSVVVAGIVEAGSFREADDMDQSEAEWIALPPDKRYPGARQMAFDVAGDSMNALQPRPIFPGDRAVCVAYEDVAHEATLRDGMVVVVERTRDGGHTREWSIKQVEIYTDRVEFHPRSTNAKHKPIVIARDVEADDGTRVEIIGLVRRVINDHFDT